MRLPDFIDASLHSRDDTFPMVTMDLKLKPGVSLRSFVIRMEPSSIVTGIATFGDGVGEDTEVEYEIGGSMDLRLARVIEP